MENTCWFFSLSSKKQLLLLSLLLMISHLYSKGKKKKQPNQPVSCIWLKIYVELSPCVPAEILSATPTLESLIRSQLC